MKDDVKALAHQIVYDRQWSLFPILADALRDAGCADEEALARMRDDPTNPLNLVALASAVPPVEEST